MGGNCDWFLWENALVVKCAHRLKGERIFLFPNLTTSKNMLGGKNAKKQNKNVLWGSITFLQFHNMLRMNIFSLDENIHSGKYSGCMGLG